MKPRQEKSQEIRYIADEQSRDAVPLITYNVIMSQTKRQYRKFEDSLKERLADGEYARIFLDVALEEYEKDGDTEAFLLALRDVAEAQGGIGKLAERTNLSSE